MCTLSFQPWRFSKFGGIVWRCFSALTMHDCTDFIVITIHDTYDLRILFGTVWLTTQCLLLSAVEARYDVCYLQWHHVEVAASSKGCLQETSCKQSNFGRFCSCPQKNGWHSLLSSIINTNIYQFELQTKKHWQHMTTLPIYTSWVLDENQDNDPH